MVKTMLRFMINLCVVCAIQHLRVINLIKIQDSSSRARIIIDF